MAPPKANLVGQRHGKLVVVEFLKPLPNGSLWLCKCDCGGMHTVTTSNFPKTSSCGCNRIDLLGRTFGRLLVVGIGKARKNGRTWICKCACGSECRVGGNHLLYGGVRSCGCLKSQMVVAKNLRHGLLTRVHRSPEMQAYIGAKGRCENPNNSAYEYYGGRGIQFRFADFEEFLRVLGLRPSELYSVDRIDNDGHYEPSNVRWATRQEQRANQFRHCHNCRASLHPSYAHLATFAGWRMPEAMA